MSFELTAAEERVRKIAREFADQEIIPLRDQLKREFEYDSAEIRRKLMKAQKKQGFHLSIIPREEGGAGLGYVAFLIAAEEMCAAWPDTSYFTYVASAYVILRRADPEIRKKWMPGVLSGDVMATIAVTEPCGGSDPLSMATTAKRNGDSWTITGRKVFIDDAEDCDFILLLAKTGDPQDPKTKGARALSAFIVEKDMPGYRISRIEDTLARKADLAEIVLDNVNVPLNYMVGDEGKGMNILFEAVGNVGRPSIMGMLNGITLGSYRCAVKYANERKLFGQSIANLQAIRHRLADMFIDLESARLFSYRAASLINKGMRCDAELSAAKYVATQAALRSSLQAINIHGAYGVVSDYMPQVFYRYSVPRIAAGGTDEAMKNIISGVCLRETNPDLSSRPAEESAL